MSSEKVKDPVMGSTPAPAPAPVDGGWLDVNVIPSEIEAPLLPPRVEDLKLPMRHTVVQRPAALVSIWSRDTQYHVVKLSVTSSSPGWNPKWIRWVYAVRRTASDLGGDALAAQDVLSAEDTELQLLVLPGEQRSATLELQAVLDGETYPGNYTFDVVMTDETGKSDTAAGTLRLRHPKSELLKYLPAIYTLPDDRKGNSYGPYEDRPFLDRFLRGFEDSTAPTDEILSRLEDFFDADSTPAEFLPWIGTWVSLTLDENWPELKRRRLIKEAVALYRWRGTRRGLSRYLEIYCGVTPQINDQPFRGMRLGPETKLGVRVAADDEHANDRPNAILGDVPPHTFVVTIAVPDVGAVNEQTIRDIIESEKPAHTAYELRLVTRRTEETEGETRADRGHNRKPDHRDIAL